MRQNKTYKKLISTFIIISLLLNSFIFPPQAYARGFFKDTFRFLRRTTHAVLSIPDKATRWMGPVLGPIASAVLTKNLIKNPKIAKIFRRARRTNQTLNKIEDIRIQIRDTKKLYHNEAKKLRDKAIELEEVRKGLASDLLKHGNWDEYKEQVAAMQSLIEIHREAANRFDTAADNVNEKNILKMLGSTALETVMGNLRDVVILEVSKDLEKVVNPELITKFLSGQSGLDTIIDFFVDKELGEYLGEDELENIDDSDLKSRIRDAIREQIKRDRDFFKDNWDQKITEIIDKKIKEMEGETSKLDESTQKKVDEITSQNTPSKFTERQQEIIDEFEKTVSKDDDERSVTPSGDKCGPGYIWRRLSGTGCVQGNCNDIPEAHWSFDGYCVCGSSGSMNEDPMDPNNECSFDASYEACPSCVYMCVHAKTPCPLDDVTFE